MSKTIMVTGAKGFIGSALVTFLQEHNEKVISIDTDVLDLCDAAAVANYPADGIDHIIHLAGLTFVPRSWEEPELFFQVNTGATLHMLEYCRVHKIPMTYISAYIYGQPEKLPISETDPVHPNNPYAKSKHLAEQLCAFYAKELGVQVSVVRPFNVYGVGQKERFLIPHIIKQVLCEEEIHVMDLAPYRDYIFLSDLLQGIYDTTRKVQDFDIFNFGSGVVYSVGEVIQMAQKIAGCDKPVISENAPRKNEMNKVQADISHAKEVLGWEPKVSMEEGLSQIIREMRG